MARSLTLVITLLALFWVLPSQGKTYRWMDDTGQVHYADIAPEGVDAEEVEGPSEPATTPNDAWRELHEKQLEVEDHLEDEELAREKEEKEAKKQAIRDKNCEAARHNLSIYQGSPNRMIRGSDGEYRRLTEEERQAKLEEAQKQIEEYCD
jgi:hypothetical protein